MQKVKQQQQKAQYIQQKQRKDKQKQQKRMKKQQKQRKRNEKQQKRLQQQAANQQKQKKQKQEANIVLQVKQSFFKQQSKKQKIIQEKDMKNNKNQKKKQDKNPRTAIDILQSVFKKKDQKIQNILKQQHPKKKSNQLYILNEQQFASLGSNIFKTGFQNSDFWGFSQINKDLQTSKKLQQSFAINSHNFFASINQKQLVSQNKKTDQNLERDFLKINYYKGKIQIQQKIKQQYSQEQQKKNFQNKIIQEVEYLKQENSAIKSQLDSSSQSDLQDNNNKQNNQAQDRCNKFSCLSISNSIEKYPHYKQNKLPYQGEEIIKQSFSDQIPCFKATIRQALSHPKFSVIISQHQVIRRNFFVPDYVMYNAKTLPNQIQVKRNYQDFIKLRKVLGQVYPGIQLPYLQKIGWLSQTHPDTITKQKLTLQFFLNDIIYNKQLRNSRIFEDFLTIKQHKKIKRKFEQYDRLSKLTCIQQLCLLSGYVNVKLNEDQRVYEQRMTQYIARMQQYFQRHKKISQNLENQYAVIMKTFKSLSELMLEIEMETCQFNKRVRCNEIKNIQKNYSMINNFYKYSYQNTEFDLNKLQQKIIPFLRFQKQNIETLREIIYPRNFMTKTYLKRVQLQKAALSAQIQPYTSDKFKHLRMEYVNKVKIYWFLNIKLCQQSQRFFELLGNKICDRLNQLGKIYIQKLNQNQLFWKNLINDYQQ